jgi:UDP-N-acetylmuramoyl-tripeptide--D-alanyl-D-alanine ligase
VTTASGVSLAAAFLVCCAMTALHDYHMFQLNSYKPREHLAWLGRNFQRDWLPRHAPALAALAASLAAPSAAVILSVLFYALQLYLNRPRKAKKPLVFTNRMKRMLVTNGALAVGIAAGSLSAGAAQPAILALALLATPLLALLSNAINSPVERAVSSWYVNDARRIIRSMPGLVVIGVTGSYGKTSTKYFLQKLLSPKYNVLMTPGNYNTALGVVKTIRTLLKPVHDVFVCEMGARQAGDIKEICDIVKPRYGVITSIGPQHLESFGSIENIIETKFELADALPDDGILFLNFDNEHIRGQESRKETVFYSASGGGDYNAREIEVSSAGSSFSVAFPGGYEGRFETKLIGRHNVSNITAAIAVADRLGVSAGDIGVCVRRLEAVPHRLQLIDRKDIIIIDDAYNSNESGAKAALEVLGMFDGFKILITPGMVELGASGDMYNRRFGAQAGAICDYVALVGERGTGSVLAGLRDAAFPEEKIYIAPDVGRAFERIAALRSGGARKVVLIENDLPDNY